MWQALTANKAIFERLILVSGSRSAAKFTASMPSAPTPRVPALPISDCARGCSNRAQVCPQLSATDVKAKTFFERLCLVLGLHKIAPWVNCPYAPTIPTIKSTTISRFLCYFFPRMAPHFFCHHDSPSNLAESRYPPHTPTAHSTTIWQLNFFVRTILKSGKSTVSRFLRKLPLRVIFLSARFTK